MTQKQKNKEKSAFWRKLTQPQSVGAKRTILEELFQDMYGRRWEIYRINFVRGVFFGFGSVLGGTILIALLVWLLSALGAVVPFLSDFIRDILEALNNRS